MLEICIKPHIIPKATKIKEFQSAHGHRLGLEFKQNVRLAKLFSAHSYEKNNIHRYTSCQ
jgi:hypothetical protein